MDDYTQSKVFQADSGKKHVRFYSGWGDYLCGAFHYSIHRPVAEKATCGKCRKTLERQLRAIQTLIEGKEAQDGDRD